MIAWCLTSAAATRAHALGWSRVQQLEESISPQQLVAAMLPR
jgi:hypothetical protein